MWGMVSAAGVGTGRPGSAAEHRLHARRTEPCSAALSSHWTLTRPPSRPDGSAGRDGGRFVLHDRRRPAELGRLPVPGRWSAARQLQRPGRRLSGRRFRQHAVGCWPARSATWECITCHGPAQERPALDRRADRYFRLGRGWAWEKQVELSSQGQCAPLLTLCRSMVTANSVRIYIFWQITIAAEISCSFYTTHGHALSAVSAIGTYTKCFFASSYT